MLLTETQAKMICAAMRAINSVGSTLIGTLKFPEGVVVTSWPNADGSVRQVTVQKIGFIPEIYNSQSAFAAEYNIDFYAKED